MADLCQAAIAGVYQTQQGDLSGLDPADVWWECARGACEDAGLTLADIDGLIGPGPQGAGIRATMPGAALGHDLLGKPLRFHATSSIGAGSTAAGLNLAVYAISAGLAEVVVIGNVVAGPGSGYSSADRDEAVAYMAKLSGPYEHVYGTTRVADYAVLAQRHMYEFGTTPEQLAEVAVAQRRGAVRHPLSFQGHRGEITVDDVLTSRMVADPLRLLDCCSINQGGAAVVVAREDAVRAAGRHAAVGLLGYGEGHSHIDPNSLDSLAEFPAAALAADTAFRIAGVSREEISVAGIGDHFTINVLFGLEAAGFCGPGESGSFVEGGALEVGGRLPVNTAGGFLSFSHAGLCGIFTNWWSNSGAIKDSPDAASASGIPVTRMRIGVFVAAAMVAALPGVVYVQYNLQANADLFLGSAALFQVLVVGLVGGSERPWGSLLGSLVITALSYYLTQAAGGRPGVGPLTFAAVFFLMALMLPRGLAGTWADLRARRMALAGPEARPPALPPDTAPS